MDILSSPRELTIGQSIYDLIEELFPLNRSITGNGVRKTFDIIKKHIPVEIKEVPSGTQVYDWIVPKEWNIKDAFIKNSKGEIVVDFKNSNLHVVSYSKPIHTKMTLEELKSHLYTIPEHPDWIPYLTTYYKEDWGFCLTHNQYEKLEDDTYEVYIDSSLQNGSLTYGELFIEGELKDEVLLSTYTCHPSMCNDNLTGPAVLVYLAKYLLNIKPRYSYRLLFIPETIGSITWLCLNEEKINNIKHGLILTCLGDRGQLTYKLSIDGNAVIDKVVKKVLEDSGEIYKLIDFFPPGSDERQYSTPGFNLPVGSLLRSCYNYFPEYHTSADNLDFISPEYLQDSYDKYVQVLYMLDYNRTYINLNPKCEPQLGKRGLYRTIGGLRDFDSALFAMLYLCNGENTLLDIAIRANEKFINVKNAADALERCNLIKAV